MLNLIAHFYDPSSGAVKLGGIDLQDMQPHVHCHSGWNGDSFIIKICITICNVLYFKVCKYEHYKKILMKHKYQSGNGAMLLIIMLLPSHFIKKALSGDDSNNPLL